MLTIYRLALGVAVAVIVVLAALLLFTKAPRFGRAIIIDGKTVVMVRNAKAASAVRERLLHEAGGAMIKEKWEDAARPAEGGEAVSIADAVKLLKPRLTVVREAFAIQTGAAPLVIVPSKEVAQRVLDKLKSRFASPSDAVVRCTSLRPTPSIRPCTALPKEIVSDEAQAVARLGSARGLPEAYVVQPGDYPDRIAARSGMSLEAFWRLNSALRGRDLKVGERVQVQSRCGLTVVTVKETVSSKPIPPPIERENSASVPLGQKKIVAAGKGGLKRVRWEITMHDEREVSRRSLSEEVTLEPEPQKVLIGTGATGG
jgi:hypothetical protein